MGTADCVKTANLSDDISFFCNDRIYPMTRGDVLIVKPGDYHHCMYRSNAEHEHFWIPFEYEQNRELWETFFKTPFKNVYRPTPEKKEELIALCDLLNNENNLPGERLGLFFDILSIIRNSGSLESGDIIVLADKNFIEIFKKYFGMTPHKFKKKYPSKLQ